LAYTPSSTAFAPGDDTIFNNTETALKAVGGAVQAAGVTGKTTVLRGDPASVICDVVNENQIDVVVISTHGRTGFKRWVYGSVANQVLHGVNCPVLVLRGVPSEAGK
jgi:nucleotide-binding universal stress UspA family protein